jgi:hypothetical protein
MPALGNGLREAGRAQCTGRGASWLRVAGLHRWKSPRRPRGHDLAYMQREGSRGVGDRGRHADLGLPLPKRGSGATTAAPRRCRRVPARRGLRSRSKRRGSAGERSTRYGTTGDFFTGTPQLILHQPGSTGAGHRCRRLSTLARGSRMPGVDGRPGCTRLARGTYWRRDRGLCRHLSRARTPRPGASSSSVWRAGAHLLAVSDHRP